MRLATAHFNLHRRLKTFRTATMKRVFYFEKIESRVFLKNVATNCVFQFTQENRKTSEMQLWNGVFSVMKSVFFVKNGVPSQGYLLRISVYTTRQEIFRFLTAKSFFFRDENNDFVSKEATFCAFQITQKTGRLQKWDHATVFCEIKIVFLWKTRLPTAHFNFHKTQKIFRHTICKWHTIWSFWHFYSNTFFLRFLLHESVLKWATFQKQGRESIRPKKKNVHNYVKTPPGQLSGKALGKISGKLSGKMSIQKSPKMLGKMSGKTLKHEEKCQEKRLSNV